MENTLYYGDNLEMPPDRQVGATFKKAERFRGKKEKQLLIPEKNHE